MESDKVIFKVGDYVRFLDIVGIVEQVDHRNNRILVKQEYPLDRWWWFKAGFMKLTEDEVKAFKIQHMRRDWE